MSAQSGSGNRNTIIIVVVIVVVLCCCCLAAAGAYYYVSITPGLLNGVSPTTQSLLRLFA